MELHHLSNKTYPYRITWENADGNKEVIGVGKTAEEAWENAAIALDNKLHQICEMFQKTIEQNF